MNRTMRYIILYGLLFLGLLGVFNLFNNPNPKMQPIRYDEFVNALEAGNIEAADMR